MTSRSPLSHRAITALATACALHLLQQAASAQVWRGGDGTWTDTTMWSFYPTPDSVATIDNSPVNSTVTWADITPAATPMIVTINAGDTLKVPAITPRWILGVTGRLELTGPNALLDLTTFGAHLSFGRGGQIVFDAPGTIRTGGIGLSLPADFTIAGPFSNIGSISNMGTISVSGAGNTTMLMKSASAAFVSNESSGTIRATAGSTLVVGGVENLGTISVDHATLKIVPGRNGSDGLFSQGLGAAVNLTDATAVITEPIYDDLQKYLSTFHLTHSTLVIQSPAFPFPRVSDGLVATDGNTIQIDTGVMSGSLSTVGTGRFTIAPGTTATFDTVGIDGRLEIGAGATAKLTNVSIIISDALIIGAGGKLSFDNARLTIPSGARLAGNLILTGTSLANIPVSLTGTLSPGDPAAVGGLGTITFTNSLSTQSGAHYAVDLGPGGASDLLAVTGTLNLSAANDFLDLTAVASLSLPYTIVTAGKIVGTFDHVTPGYALRYTSTSITVVPEPTALVLAVGAILVASRRRRT